MSEMVGIIVLILIITTMIKIIMLAGQYSNTERNRTTGYQSNLPARRNRTGNTGATETGPMIYYANDRHGSRDKEYQFNYKRVGGSWRAYILRMPDLGNRESGGHVTHRLYDNGRPYVCWDRPVNTLKDMQTISKVWADNIQEYIATGRRFG